MKFNFIYLCFFSAFALLVLQSRSSGPASAGLGDLTGFSGGNCSNCHSGGNHGSALAIQVKDAGGSVVTSYIPGQTYDVEYAVTSTATNVSYGFQGAAFLANGTSIGTWGTPNSTNTKVTNSTYVEHSSRAAGSGSFTFSIPWTAPVVGTGDVGFYGSGISVNGSGTGGDDPTTSVSITLTEAAAPLSISYGKTDFCQDEVVASPTITGASNFGTYTATPTGLVIQGSLGIIDLQNSTPGTYTVQFAPTTGGSTTTIIQVLETAKSTDVQSACGSYTWIDGNTYTTSNNSAQFTLSGQAANGCDSIVTLDLTILTPAQGTDVQSACGSYTWIDGNTYTTSNNSAQFTLSGQAANGCDSIATLDLTITTVNTGVTQNNNVLSATATNVSYQWLDCNNGNSPIAGATSQDYTATASGSYAVEITENNCVDTSACVQVVISNSIALQGNSSFAVYPNPNRGELYLQFGEVEENIEVELLSLQGQLLQRFHAEQTKEIRLVLNHPAGTYYLKVTNTKGETFVEQIVKQ